MAKINGLAPVVEAVRVPLFQINGDWTDVENLETSPQRLFETVKYVVEALVMVPFVANSRVPVALVKLNSVTVPLVANNLVVVELVTVSSETFPVVPQKVGRVA
ncbi:MAG: hypothetical protein UV39_C0025G0009 [Candidatus Azambacteria bacterium GW2011_GWA2_42_62]|nr:MAG: hypothetical protein UV39_C0025G0009 [Candidatus Azambacteria bacterium GW2011_GWA2_42_62]